jgi:Protein of unknown function (DUF4446)
VNSLSSAQGVAALVGAGGAVVALVACGTLALTVRRLRAGQRAILGERGVADLVDHAVELQAAFGALRDWVEAVATTLDARLGEAEARLSGAVTHRALVRYDAYNEMSGRQSLSIALLDDTRSGIVLSSIHHRDQARIYAKQVHGGKSELELSPEEQEALRLALGGGK